MIILWIFYRLSKIRNDLSNVIYYYSNKNIKLLFLILLYSSNLYLLQFFFCCLLEFLSITRMFKKVMQIMPFVWVSCLISHLSLQSIIAVCLEKLFYFFFRVFLINSCRIFFQLYQLIARYLLLLWIIILLLYMVPRQLSAIIRCRFRRIILQLIN
jgi:hypothetical protein